MTTRRTVLGVGLAGMLPCDDVLDLAVAHPAANPGFTLTVDVDASDTVVATDVFAGLMHRSAEKLFEARDYRQGMLLANRHDWLSSFCGELTIALAAEDALGIVPPERATWIRTLVVEAQRIDAALAFLAPVVGSARADAERVREMLAVTLATLTGARVHPGYARIGGVAHAAPTAALDAYEQVASAAGAVVGPLGDAVEDYAVDVAGLAALTTAQAKSLGTSGIVARASGFDVDLRRDDPALAYAELGDVVTTTVLTDGDASARYRLLVDQVADAARVVDACVSRLRVLGPGSIDVRLPKIVRLPEGSTYSWLEGPLGICGAFVVSTGEKAPWRLKIRSASFATMQAMTAALVGVPRSNLAAAVLSFPFVLGDVDR